MARFDALTARAIIGGWHGDMDEVVLYMERAYALAMDAGRKDLQTIAAQVLAQTHIVRLELDEAELLLTRALELAGESGSIRARAGASLSYGWFLAIKGELDAAETVYEEVRQRRPSSASSRRSRSHSCVSGGWQCERGDYKRRREALPRGAPDHGDPRRSRLAARPAGFSRGSARSARQDRRSRASGARGAGEPKAR